ncbi:hypothetical protein ACN42_g5226 [Penicillium freii]|uniref:2EXR domain-containing protein n=1 Tax=Penicillium freii TaxID=48697 RepID=A0A101MJT6_PENFR|nr:hypothetical protein ACN42_g5226 [Penicillium freii]
MSNDAFHYFSKLPLELRRMIWMHCLPHRIAEEDTPESFFDGYNSKHVCWSRRMTLQNAQLPAIAYINSESRQVALEQGRLLEPADVRTMESLWVQPHRDVLHLNWTRLTYASWGVPSDAPGWVDEFLLQAKDLGMQPSIAADLIHFFSLKAVLDCAGDANALGTHNHFQFGTSDIAKIREVALKSDLFGLLGDAPVQMADVDDEARLREFQALYREHALEKEPVVQTLFETFTSSLFKTAVEIWKRKAEWTILAYMWQSARDRNLDILGTNPGSAWLPQLSEQKETYIYMDRYLPNEQHPWVKHARQTAPKLRLRIMVRYCANQCYIKERVPKGFALK